jgi:hypothetical protein
MIEPPIRYGLSIDVVSVNKCLKPDVVYSFRKIVNEMINQM